MTRTPQPVAFSQPAEPAHRLGGGTSRRTTSIDFLSPDGPGAPSYVDARARDAVGRHGKVVTVTSASCALELERWSRLVHSLTSTPVVAALEELVGTSATKGFRRRAAGALTDEPSHRLLYQLLDDLSGASIVADSYVTARADLRPPPGQAFAVATDACAGFVSGGTALELIAATEEMAFTSGPPVTPLTMDVSEGGWHEMDPLAADGFRRVRRIDVRPLGSGALEIDAHFRDSYAQHEGVETIIHEYRFMARADADLYVVEVTALPHVLPWTECPNAATSARRIIGVRLADLRNHVRDKLTGPSTCTHLNDVMRALADVPELFDLTLPPG